MNSVERPAIDDHPHCVGYFIGEDLIYYFKSETIPCIIDYMAYDAAIIQHEDKSISGNFENMDRRYFTSDALYDNM